MYDTHWGLEYPPFTGRDVRSFYYEGQPQAEALSRMRFLATQRRLGGLLIGPRGSGKTATLEFFRRQCQQSGRTTASVSGSVVSPHELYWQIASQLDASPRPSDDLDRLHRRLNDLALAVAQQDENVVLLIDDVDQADAEVLSHIVRLLAIDSMRSWLTVMLTWQSDAAGQLSRTVVDRLDLQVELLPWEPEDTFGYVQYALFEAGRETPLFNEAALQLLHELSGGVPRQVNRLADHALLTAASRRSAEVDASDVESALEEATWPR